MKIKTNLSKMCVVHDTIKYDSLEKQTYNLLCRVFESPFDYEIDRDGFTVVMGDFRFPMRVTKGGMKVSMGPRHGCIFFGKLGRSGYPDILLSYNIDLTDRLNQFKAKVDKVRELTDAGKTIARNKIDAKKIEQFLQQELGTDRCTISFWLENLFDGTEITFYIYPIHGRRPADGVIACIEKDTNKIVPFWDGSTVSRTSLTGCKAIIEGAVGDGYCNDIESLNRKIADVQELKSKIDGFNPTKSKELMALIDAKRNADYLLAEFNKT